MSTKRFRIAFSFAGEKRPFVAEVAHLLAKQFGEDKILYDHNLEAEFADANLGFDLPTYYKEETDLIVMVFCKDYESKEWCGLEWRAIYSLIKENKSKQVMLCRFDFAEVKGLYGIEGFIELDKKTPELFAQRILERLATNEDKPKDHYTKPTADEKKRKLIPHNMPALQPFFGREDELLQIAAALEPENRGWGILIDAPGGMGKTSLAVRAAHNLREGLFDKVVFVTLKSREMDDDGERKLTVFLISGLAELFNELARELGQDDITKAVETDRPRMILQALRDTNTLLILDNLESLTKEERDTVFTFVKRLPQGCKAILTARERIGTGAEELILGELEEEAGLETLAELATHNTLLARTSPEERVKLYNATTGKPLLLRWTAGQIGRGHCTNVDEAIAFLRSCPEGNDPLEFIFGDLVKAFTEAETKVLCALTYFTLPAKVEHIALIIGCAEVEVKFALKSLSNRSLLVPSKEFDTFTLIPLVADFLRKSRSDIIREAGVHLDDKAYELAEQNGYNNHEKFSILDENWPIVAAALPGFLNNSKEKLENMCNAFRDFLHFTGRWDEWLAFSLATETRFAANNDFYNAGWSAFDAGWVYYLRKQATEVLAVAEQITEYWNKANAGIRERATAIRLRGMGYKIMKDYPAALNAYKESVALFREINTESDDVAILVNGIATIEEMLNDNEAAERDYKEALRIAIAIGFVWGQATYTGNLGCLMLDMGDLPAAEMYAYEALQLSEKVGRIELIAFNCSILGRALVKQDKKVDAIEYVKRALEIYTQLGLHDDIANVKALLQECEENNPNTEE